MPAATATQTATVTFTVGETYEARSASNWDCVWTFKVIARTAKFLTLQSRSYLNGSDLTDTKRVGVRVWNGSEAASPLGSYSMAPVLRADRPTVSR